MPSLERAGCSRNEAILGPFYRGNSSTSMRLLKKKGSDNPLSRIRFAFCNAVSARGGAMREACSDRTVASPLQCIQAHTAPWAIDRQRYKAIVAIDQMPTIKPDHLTGTPRTLHFAGRDAAPIFQQAADDFISVATLAWASFGHYSGCCTTKPTLIGYRLRRKAMHHRSRARNSLAKISPILNWNFCAETFEPTVGQSR